MGVGTYVLSRGHFESRYLKALNTRKVIQNNFEEAFKKVDIILTPTTPTTAFHIDENNENPVDMYNNDIFTVPASLTGMPAISIPINFTQEGLPVSIQLTAPRFKENILFK